MNDITKIEKIINRCLDTGAEFAEYFYESTKQKTYLLLSSKLESITPNFINGIGIRLSLNDNKVYGSTNILDENNIDNLIKELTSNYNEKRKFDYIKLSLETVKDNQNIKININDYSIENKKELLYKIDKHAREKSKYINQVEIKLFEETQDVIIANQKGKYIKDNRTRIRLYITLFGIKNEKQDNSTKSFAITGGYEFLDSLNIEQEIDELIKDLEGKLDAKSCEGGQMPVIIGNGFGGVIFHEACAHSLEATTVAKNIGVFANKIGQKIASDKVTLIDDGTLKNEWGSMNIDDEGNRTTKNILIEKGILKNYIIDDLNGKVMNMASTGSARRENYHYCPTSRMSNTYLLKGNDNIDDMIKSIKYGLYAKKMGGGSVNQVTGDFNFSVRSANIIRNGKIEEAVTGICLIGNGSEILKNVEMVGNDLKLDHGYCGADSGSIPVNVGQPTIKVSKILVGGKGSDK